MTPTTKRRIFFQPFLMGDNALCKSLTSKKRSGPRILSRQRAMNGLREHEHVLTLANQTRAFAADVINALEGV
jgi:hypothetical protein